MRVAYLGNFEPPHSTENHVAQAFEDVGCEVLRIQEGSLQAVEVPDMVEAYDPAFFLHTQTLGLALGMGTERDRMRMVNALAEICPTVGYHLDLWWGLDREDQVANEPFFRHNLIITADGGHEGDWARCGINHAWLPPAVSRRECELGKFKGEYAKDVAFVGSWSSYHHESVHRFELIQWLKSNFSPRQFGLWPKTGQPAIRGEDLRDLYASARVVVGDSCLVGEGIRRYWSDRIPETVGRAGCLLHPWVDGLDEHFKVGVHFESWLPYDWARLGMLIEGLLSDQQRRDDMRFEGRDWVLRHHTYDVRAKQIIAAVFSE